MIREYIRIEKMDADDLERSISQKQRVIQMFGLNKIPMTDALLAIKNNIKCIGNIPSPTEIILGQWDVYKMNAEELNSIILLPADYKFCN